MYRLVCITNHLLLFVIKISPASHATSQCAGTPTPTGRLASTIHDRLIVPSVTSTCIKYDMKVSMGFLGFL